MAPFVFPTARNSEHANELWRMTRSYLAELIAAPIVDTRIRTVAWEHAGRRHRAVVGHRLPQASDIVLAICEAPGEYLLCTRRRGFLAGQPLRVNKGIVRSLELFDPPVVTPQGMAHQ
jgi:hypothetical protein